MSTAQLNYGQLGRDVANAERGALRAWLTMTVAIREAGPADSDAYNQARDEARDGYVARGGSPNTFKSKLSNCNVIIDANAGRSVADIAKEFTSVPDAYRAARAPKGPDGNPVVTPKSADERRADVRAAVRLALSHGVDVADIIQDVRTEADKQAK